MTSLQNYQVDQESNQDNIQNIKKYVDEDIPSMFGQLQLNRFFASCKTLTAQDNEIPFDKQFKDIPTLLVTANKFAIEYGANGSLSKFDINCSASEKKVTCDFESVPATGSVPVCILAFENKSQ